MQRSKSRYTKYVWLKHLDHILLVIFVLVLTLLPLIGSDAFAYQGRLQVWFFDVGQGDATFIVTPDGTQILIDGGRDKVVLSKLAQVMPMFDRSIDIVISTHPDADHITGLVDVLERYDVKIVIETGARAITPMDAALDQAIDNEHALHRLVRVGDVIEAGEVTLTVVWPQTTYPDKIVKDRNDASIVLWLTYGRTDVLLNADAEARAEEGLLDVVADVDVLKVGHHGSISSSTPAFLNRVRPEVAIISSGIDNRYGHPHPAVIERLLGIGANVLRTDLDGDILLTSDGGEPSVAPAPLSF
jgi:competence protein ComEC